MSAEGEQIDELLTGHMDGELSAEESQRVEAILSRDSEISRRYERLQAVRGLLAIAPEARLPGEFSARVLQAASQRASQMGSQAPAWIPCPNTINPNPDSMPRVTHPHRGAIAAVLAIAASLAIFAFCVREKPVHSLFDSRLTQNPQPAPSPAAVPSDGNELLSQSVTQQKDDLPSVDNTSNQSVASNSNSVVESTKSALPSIDGPSVPIAIPETKPQEVVVAEAKPQDDPTATNLAQAKLLDQSLKMGQELSLMLVVDISVTQKAWEEGTVLEILERFQIPQDEAVTLDATARQNLIQAKMIVDSQSTDASRVAIVFARARSSSLDGAITEMYRRVDEFPSFSLNLSMDPPVLNTLQWLRGLNQFGSSKDVARVLRSSDSPSGGALVASWMAPAKAISSAKRKRVKPIKLDFNPVSYCMFILRPEMQP